MNVADGISLDATKYHGTSRHVDEMGHVSLAGTYQLNTCLLLYIYIYILIID